MTCANPVRSWLGACLLGLAGMVLPTSGGAQTASSPSSAATTPKARAGSGHSAGSEHSTAKKKSTKSATHHGSSHASTRKKSSRGKTAKKRGQQAIDPTRAREIQEALIRDHYMQGEPSGTWDAATQSAMQRYQADQGWQSKTTPDSRALIKLGLGPSHDHLLNPESAMTGAAPTGDPKADAKPGSADDNVPKQ